MISRKPGSIAEIFRCFTRVMADIKVPAKHPWAQGTNEDTLVALPWFLIYGTLISQLRSGRFDSPWDNDVDFAYFGEHIPYILNATKPARMAEYRTRFPECKPFKDMHMKLLVDNHWYMADEYFKQKVTRSNKHWNNELQFEPYDPVPWVNPVQAQHEVPHTHTHT